MNFQKHAKNFRKKIPKKTSRNPVKLDINSSNFPFQIAAEELNF
jgi:hypothetical protein